MLTLSQAVKEYNSRRGPGEDQGIVGAWRAMCVAHGDNAVPSLERILDERAKRSPGYETTIDHRFSPEEQETYDRLSARGRSYYDSLRWHSAHDHEAAVAAAVDAYGWKRRRG